jgi:8-oxo-dGTP diphosphatase
MWLTRCCRGRQQNGAAELPRQVSTLRRWSMKPKVHILAREVIEDTRYFLLAYFRYAVYTFLPCGHVDSGEGLVTCFRRDLRGELGVLSRVGTYLGAVEHVWHDVAGSHDEINQCFEVSSPHLTSMAQVTSCELTLEFLRVHQREFDRDDLQPAPFRALLTAEPHGSVGGWWVSTGVMRAFPPGTIGVMRTGGNVRLKL